ncbi:MAG: DUF4258 domain-containing protein [Rhizobiales bacterium]|nr:DUF4258 domain-containing protein [Hyphomicrobiales bacterium]
MNEKRVIFTQHAETMLAERSIERQWVDRTVAEPDAIEPDPERNNVFRAFRSIPEHQGRVLRVVYALSGNQIRIITAFFDRARNR